MVTYRVWLGKRFRVFLALVGLSLAMVSCNGGSISSFLARVNTRMQVEHLVPQVLASRPHDVTAFTEGLVWHAGSLYESAGLYGESSLRQVDPQTGKIIRRVALSAQYFGEGLTLAADRLVQLTWHEQVAFLYDVNTFGKVGELSYTGEGWGLTFDGKQFYQSDGSPMIYVRDGNTFAVTRGFTVTLDGQPVDELNELEYVGGSLYANVWHTNNILRIDPASGRVTAVIDASGLLTPKEIADAGTEGVLNGIAYDSQKDTFWITGKLWPWMFEVKFVPRKS
jgi:glutaminyl-peptide cyclotransferase